MGAPVDLSATPKACSYLQCGPHTATIAPGTPVWRSVAEIALSSRLDVSLPAHQTPRSPHCEPVCAHAGLMPLSGASTNTPEANPATSARRHREPLEERTDRTTAASWGND
jgi:hypothetical protein